MTDALRTDLYQLTMMQAYWHSGRNPEATFDYFIRKTPAGSYLLTAGLTYFLDYIENLRFGDDDLDYLETQGFNPEFLDFLRDFRFTGDILAMPEGSIAFPLEPIIRVTAPIIEAQLVETYLLNRMNFSTLIATKASRTVYAARGRAVSEFGLRRAQGNAYLEATRATFIGGCASTSNVMAGKELGIPISGTMAHSFVTSFDREIDSFRAYADTFPKKCFLLIDTYDTVEGAKKAAIVGKELEQKGEKLMGVRLDSGDLCELSKQVRKLLDDAGLSYVKLVASGDLNEWKIDEHMRNGAKIDIFGVGTELVTGRPTPALDGIYKLSDVVENGIHIPKMKLSEEVLKTTLPGKKLVWRILEDGMFSKDVISLEGEVIAGAEQLLVPVVKGGKVIYERPTLPGIRNRVEGNLSKLPDRFRKLEDSPVYPVGFSPGLSALKKKMVEKIKHEEIGLD
ncbi:MAG: nicotinate phosphoribosyltransferase [Candidatus Methanoperedenaceae archaeon HGW-Methanoperedenaceae-1]|jgi:nicotinate phosphoribosyltransferase|nr:MAG: nicotinate phosphoribosyltransferase [Candidatus Methanoperedenaceae archaeon HGW-Methanoperedenaceae-1]